MEKCETRKCNRCGDIKPVSEFYIFYRDKAKTRSYLRPDCKICFNRMSKTGKIKNRIDKLFKGKSSGVIKRKAAYRYNRDEILRKVRNQSKNIPQKAKTALVHGELADLIEEKKEDGICKDQKPKKKRQRSPSRKLRCGDAGKKNPDS